MPIRVLISGGAGYIGTVLCNYLNDYKINFAIIDNFSTSSPKQIFLITIFYIFLYLFII